MWAYGNHTSNNTYAITGTIYTDAGLTIPANITGFTLTFRMFSEPSGSNALEDSASIISAGSGTWRYKPADGMMPGRGVYTVCIQAVSATAHLDTINRVEMLVK